MNKKQKLTMLLTFFIVIGHLFVVSLMGHADEKDDIEKSTGYKYEIKFPENQIRASGALYLLMTPGQTQEVPVEYTNLGTEEVTVLLSLNTARTSSGGVIDYGPSDFLADESLAYELSDLVEAPEDVTIPAGGKTTIHLKIKMPEVGFKGIVLGGLEMRKKEEAKQEVTDATQMVVNKIAYLFGITLTMEDEPIEPDLTLKKVYPGMQNYVSTYFVDIANTTATKISDLTSEVEIVHTKNPTYVYNSRKNNIEMAPNSLMNYSVRLNGEPMIAGEYTATIKIFNEEKKWEWTETFKVSEKEADKFNKEDVSLIQKERLDWKFVAAVVVGGTLVMIGLYVVVRTTKKKKSGKKTKKRGSKK